MNPTFSILWLGMKTLKPITIKPTNGFLCRYSCIWSSNNNAYSGKSACISNMGTPAWFELSRPLSGPDHHDYKKGQDMPSRPSCSLRNKAGLLPDRSSDNSTIENRWSSKIFSNKFRPQSFSFLLLDGVRWCPI